MVLLPAPVSPLPCKNTADPGTLYQLLQFEKGTWSTLAAQAASRISNAEAFLALEQRLQQQQQEARSRVVTLSVTLATLARAEKLSVKRAGSSPLL